MLFETENIEFKSLFTDEVYKEVIAFANTSGGTVYIGIDDNGQVVGLHDMDDTYTRITNGIRDAVYPDITMFAKCKLRDGNVIEITVSEGSYKPYYLKSKGIKPSGVYVRQGTSSVQASPEQIRQMIKSTDGDIYEEMRCMEQQLTFSQAQSAFARYGVVFAEEKFRALRITDESNKLYTNLGYILSDQCRHTVKIAVFGDEAKTRFRDSKEFGGSIFKQLEDVFSYLTLCNQTVLTFKGLERIESTDYPEDALREALLNALVHRDYSYSGSIIINITDSEIEFISIGGLLPGLSAADIQSGISQPRNKNLADIFYRLRLIESYGTGIRKIYNLYEKCARQPHIAITPNTFKIILPNMNKAVQANEKETSFCTPQMQAILIFIEKNGFITESQVRELLDVKKTRAYNILKEMCVKNLVAASGKGENKRYMRVGNG